MPFQKKTKLRTAFRWIFWVLLVQLVLANISAAFYAYKFTHFYNGPAPAHVESNLMVKTWKLFVGPRFYKLSEEGLPDFPVEQVHLKTSANLPIDAWYSTVDSAKGCVLLFHGIMVNKTYVEREAAKFRQWGYNVLMTDFRGHGKSGGNTTDFGEDETDEVQQAFDFAKSRGNNNIILYGVSMGAMVCIKAVADKRVSPIAMIADMPCGSLHSHLKSRARMLGFPSEPFGSLVTMWIGWERGYNGFSHDVTRYATSVHCPVLIEWGDQDPLVTREEVDEIYRNISSSNKRMIVYPGVGHDSFLRSDPNRWERELPAFLNGIPG